MSTEDLTIAILREIRREVRETRAELGERIDQTRTELGERLDETRAELGGQIVELGERLDVTNERVGAVESTLQELAGQQVILTRYVKHSIDRHDAAIEDLRDRVGRIEG